MLLDFMMKRNLCSYVNFDKYIYIYEDNRLYVLYDILIEN